MITAGRQDTDLLPILGLGSMALTSGGVGGGLGSGRVRSIERFCTGMNLSPFGGWAVLGGRKGWGGYHGEA